MWFYFVFTSKTWNFQSSLKLFKWWTICAKVMKLGIWTKKNGNIIVKIIIKRCLGKDKDNETQWPRERFYFCNINRNRLSYFYDWFHYLAEYFIFHCYLWASLPFVKTTEKNTHNTKYREPNREYSSIKFRAKFYFSSRFFSPER